jgi:hypothetical protein
VITNSNKAKRWINIGETNSNSILKELEPKYQDIEKKGAARVFLCIMLPRQAYNMI